MARSEVQAVLCLQNIRRRLLGQTHNPNSKRTTQTANAQPKRQTHNPNSKRTTQTANAQPKQQTANAQPKQQTHNPNSTT
ncbi:MAG: hypothetical protein AAFQ83_13925 [Bacteroidota bacterium]